MSAGPEVAVLNQYSNRWELEVWYNWRLPEFLEETNQKLAEYIEYSLDKELGMIIHLGLLLPARSHISPPSFVSAPPKNKITFLPTIFVRESIPQFYKTKSSDPTIFWVSLFIFWVSLHSIFLIPVFFSKSTNKNYVWILCSFKEKLTI